MNTIGLFAFIVICTVTIITGILVIKDIVEVRKNND
jgi:hypothetical protein